MAKRKGGNELSSSERVQTESVTAMSFVEADESLSKLDKSKKKEMDVANKQTLDAIHDDSRAIGILQKIQYDNAHNELLKYAVIFQVKQNKAYRKGGATWAEFCEKIGEPRKTIDEKLRDVRPIFENFSANFAKLSNVPFNKIRYLGRSLLADPPKIDNNSILIDGVEIPLSPESKDDIEALIDTLKETHSKGQKTLSNKIKRLKNTFEKNVAAETENIQIQLDATIKENKRLKVFDLEEKDNTWSLQMMEIVETLSFDLNSACRRLMVDKRIKDDFALQAQVEAKMDQAIKCLLNFKEDWDAEFEPEIIE